MNNRKTKIPTPVPSPPAPQPSRVEAAMGVLRPSLLAANTISKLMSTDAAPLDVGALTAVLGEQCRRAIDGDLSRAEAMLVSQAHTLDALFCALTHRATMNMGEYLNAAESYMRLALKAQSQCRATLETLAVLKNPPHPTFIRQANVAHGPQQVNNGIPAPEASRERFAERAEQTFGARAWSTAGHPHGGHGKRR